MTIKGSDRHVCARAGEAQVVHSWMVVCLSRAANMMQVTDQCDERDVVIDKGTQRDSERYSYRSNPLPGKPSSSQCSADMGTGYEGVGKEKP